MPAFWYFFSGEKKYRTNAYALANPKLTATKGKASTQTKLRAAPPKPTAVKGKA